eukprot:gnl/Dysnectes_brevis/8949_a16296_161.p1 GENE.gnl/Dysnectes_brevis/8949_a16296_161~~gnl/Dysnectes_brevis/8949_a16296_161.p1  ORF type:complete len:763 (-),score=200.41 gnl/Dysnectes_brevis/8949_a16296_161:170-2458(-)
MTQKHPLLAKIKANERQIQVLSPSILISSSKHLIKSTTVTVDNLAKTEDPDIIDEAIMILWRSIFYRTISRFREDIAALKTQMQGPSATKLTKKKLHISIKQFKLILKMATQSFSNILCTLIDRLTSSLTQGLFLLEDEVKVIGKPLPKQDWSPNHPGTSIALDPVVSGKLRALAAKEQLRMAIQTVGRPLLCLGDLARYGAILGDATTRMHSAEIHYRLCADVLPSNGSAFNQLALIAMKRPKDCLSPYLFTRAMLASKPAAIAGANLRLVLSDHMRKAEHLERILRRKFSFPGDGEKDGRPVSEWDSITTATLLRLERKLSLPTEQTALYRFFAVTGLLVCHTSLEKVGRWIHQFGLTFPAALRDRGAGGTSPLRQERVTEMVAITIFVLEDASKLETDDPRRPAQLDGSRLLTLAMLDGLTRKGCDAFLPAMVLLLQWMEQNPWAFLGQMGSIGELTPEEALAHLRSSTVPATTKTVPPVSPSAAGHISRLQGYLHQLISTMVDAGEKDHTLQPPLQPLALREAQLMAAAVQLAEDAERQGTESLAFPFPAHVRIPSSLLPELAGTHQEGRDTLPDLQAQVRRTRVLLSCIRLLALLETVAPTHVSLPPSTHAGQWSLPREMGVALGLVPEELPQEPRPRLAFVDPTPAELAEPKDTKPPVSIRQPPAARPQLGFSEDVHGHRPIVLDTTAASQESGVPETLPLDDKDPSSHLEGTGTPSDASSGQDGAGYSLFSGGLNIAGFQSDGSSSQMNWGFNFN